MPHGIVDVKLSTCPSCGYCPNCGRTGQPTPAVLQPWWQWRPEFGPWYVTFGGQPATSQTITVTGSQTIGYHAPVDSSVPATFTN